MKKAILLHATFEVEPTTQTPSAQSSEGLDSGQLLHQVLTDIAETNEAILSIAVKKMEAEGQQIKTTLFVKGECAPAVHFEGFVLTILQEQLLNSGITLKHAAEGDSENEVEDTAPQAEPDKLPLPADAPSLPKTDLENKSFTDVAPNS